MIYDYTCEKCDENTEIVKPMSESSKPEQCVKCGNTLRRLYSAKFHFMGEKIVDAQYYPSLGKVVKNNYERSEEMKKRNLIEVGNEKPERIRYYTERHRKEKIARDYED